MFLINTDGMENASSEYKHEKIKKIFEYQREKYGQEFICLGANIDATSTAAKFGIGSDRAANYNADGEGTSLNYETVSLAVSELRANRPITENWKIEIEKDFTNRSKKARDSRKLNLSSRTSVLLSW